MKSLWNWLSVDRNRQVLTFIGGGLAAIGMAGWAVFVFLVDHREVKPGAESPPPMSPIVSAAAANDEKAKANVLNREADALNGIADEIAGANKPARK